MGGLCSSISKKTVRTIRSKLDQCVAPNLTMCLLYLSVYGCCKLTELNDFIVVFSTLCYYRPSAIPPTVAPSVALLAGETGRS